MFGTDAGYGDEACSAGSGGALKGKAVQLVQGCLSRPCASQCMSRQCSRNDMFSMASAHCGPLQSPVSS
eukprot:7041950-Alexandrium_andersonii.AAC.1